MFGFFKKNNKLVVKSPLNGKIVDLKDVDDPVFSQCILGQGIAILPDDSGIIKSPIDGSIEQIFETKHAFIVKSDCGISILVHFGLDTVTLKGQGFEILKKDNKKVSAGEPILAYNIDFLRENCKSLVSPIIVLDSDNYKEIEFLKGSNDTVSQEDELLVVER